MGGNWEDPNNNRGNLAETHDGGETLIAEGTGPGYRSSIVHHPNFRISWWPLDFQVLTSASTEAGLGTRERQQPLRRQVFTKRKCNVVGWETRLVQGQLTSLVNDLQVNDPAAIGKGKSIRTCEDWERPSPLCQLSL